MNTDSPLRAPSNRPGAQSVLILLPALTSLLITAAWLGAAPAVRAQYPASPQIVKDGAAVLLENYATAPLSSRTFGTYSPTNPIIYSDQLSRINFMRAEPADAPLATNRFFVCDLNRNLYIVDRTNALSTNAWTKYINFEEVFPRFDDDPGFAGGLVTFQFDPEYASNGVFYTAHMETTFSTMGPTNGALPGFDTNGYTTTTSINPPSGTVGRIAVLVEWKDTNIANVTFEGTAREILRMGFLGTIHPMGDLLYNPLAKPGDDDYRNLYVAVGDGRAGENTTLGTHTHPQRLDALVGKILRITPDLNLRTNDVLSSNGRYRIPSTGSDPNPFANTNAWFTNLTNVKKEIFAYGFRNCHRISWDAPSNLLLEDDIGFHAWEEVNIIHKGTNYGYAEREGIEQVFMFSGGLTGSQLGVPFPTNSDYLTVTGLVSAVTPTYPVACYSHVDGDAISSGFVYRGKLLPQLYGKYIFGDITTARLLYCDLNEMIGADDGDRMSLATIHEIQALFDSPNDSPDQGAVPRRVFDIVAETYTNRGGDAPGVAALPGAANGTDGSDPDGVPYGGGRADIRFAVGGDNELYLISKSDGMIRRFAQAVSPPLIQSVVATNGTFTVLWQSVSNRSYRVQYKASIQDTWSDLPGDVTATGPTTSKSDPIASDARFFRVVYLP